MQESQNHSAMNGKGVMLGVILLVIGGLAGFAITKATTSADSMHTHSSMSETSDKAADLRANLVAAGIQHMHLTAQAVDGALNGTADADAYGKALYKNGTDIGAAVGSVYGADAEKTFNTVWKLHLDEFVKYAVAGKSADEAGKQAALESIDANYTKPLAQYLAKANPNLPEKELESSLREHVQMTAEMIDSHVAGNYATETEQLAAADKHIAGLFTVLATGIAQQFPDKF